MSTAGSSAVCASARPAKGPTNPLPAAAPAAAAAPFRRFLRDSLNDMEDRPFRLLLQLVRNHADASTALHTYAQRRRGFGSSLAALTA